MISPKYFVSYLESKGYQFYTGVPCSYFKSVLNFLEEARNSSYRIAPNEGSALALASGAFLGGHGSVLMIQNSGLGNLINPLTSLSLIYEIPVLIFVSGRAYGFQDEPQHKVIGKAMGKLLDSIGLLHWDLPMEENEMADILEQGIGEANKRKSPVVFFVRKNTFSAWPRRLQTMTSSYPMTRIEAIRIICDFISKDDLILSTTGKISRELFLVGDRESNFYMQGSMGHVSAIALGVALSQPDRRVIVLDGDGALLMHMGVMPTIGFYEPKKFIHIVLDNESYESTGDQDTISSRIDFEGIAKASGYRWADHVSDPEKLRMILPETFNQTGPVFLRVKINRTETKDVPRITSRYSAPQITEAFKQAGDHVTHV